MGASKSSGFTVGQTFNSRREVWNAGIHSHLQAGIDGTGVTGARAIVVSGGYPDDRDPEP
ncbi:hypothetical protein J4H86_00955 [Spiractinospora alimapuensis]|uniref:YDG/SRA domain-containing protein n=1 Tax=Spiractinospora alimapuensis TaxID=2820884 RepID=UPI0037436270|nr:hypothetical protein J4H86_00955 [Spiractinospora alimapuensis]